MWRQTPSFQPIQGNPDFERIVAASALLKSRISLQPGRPCSHTCPKITRRLAAVDSVARNMLTAAHTLPFWQPAVSQGWALAIPNPRRPCTKARMAGMTLNLTGQRAGTLRTITKTNCLRPEARGTSGHSMATRGDSNGVDRLAERTRFVANGPRSVPGCTGEIGCPTAHSA